MSRIDGCFIVPPILHLKCNAVMMSSRRSLSVLIISIWSLILLLNLILSKIISHIFHYLKHLLSDGHSHIHLLFSASQRARQKQNAFHSCILFCLEAKLNSSRQGGINYRTPQVFSMLEFVSCLSFHQK